MACLNVIKFMIMGPQDRFAERLSLPVIDDSQDWTLVDGKFEDGNTIIEMRRKFVTCDDAQDVDITVCISQLASVPDHTHFPHPFLKPHPPFFIWSLIR